VAIDIPQLYLKSQVWKRQ